MTTMPLAPPFPEAVLPLWPEDLRVSEHAKDTMHRYKSVVQGFLTRSTSQKQRPLTFSTLAPIALVGYHTQTSAHSSRHIFAHDYLIEHPGDIIGLAPCGGLFPSIPRENMASLTLATRNPCGAINSGCVYWLTEDTD